MIALKTFLRRYGFENDALAVASLDWKELVAICEDHTSRLDTLAGIAALLVKRYKAMPEAHFVKHRIKDPEHLMEKILRLSLTEKRAITSFSNYKKDIGDLIGIRIIHKFKDQWESIHDQVMGSSRTKGQPEVFYQEGDPETLLEGYRKKGILAKKREVGYRSIHYDILVDFEREDLCAELQVRTLFEEAWGEIDHEIRYPYDTEDSLLNKYFHTCALVSGLADELGSLTRLHKIEKELSKKLGRKAALARSQVVTEIDAGLERLAPRAERVRQKLEGLGK